MAFQLIFLQKHIHIYFVKIQLYVKKGEPIPPLKS